MGLLSEIMGGLGGQGAGQPGMPNQGSPLGGLGGSLLGGGLSSAVVPVLLGLLASNTFGSANQQAGNQAGGSPLSGLLGRFEQAGLGGIAQSWVGTGQNQAISPQQLHGVLGDEQVQSMASQAGVQPHDLLSQLSQALPQLIDKLTPNGQLPSHEDLHMPEKVSA